MFVFIQNDLTCCNDFLKFIFSLNNNKVSHFIFFPCYFVSVANVPLFQNGHLSINSTSVNYFESRCKKNNGIHEKM